MNTLLTNPSNRGGQRSTDQIKYIVIHYTANRGDTAKNNAVYFNREVVKASAHYFVDENEVWQSVPDHYIAWHCGGGLQGTGGASFHKKCTNTNSVGIEMCLLDRKGNIRNKTIEKAIELTKELMKKYNVPVDRVIRHWDVTSKSCPAPMIGTNNSLWKSFKEKLVNLEEEKDMVRYNTFEEIPGYAKSVVKKLMDHKTLCGDGKNLDLSEDMLRMLVFNDREGLYD